MSYGPFRKAISPPWLLGRNGAAWAEALGSLQDFVADRTKAGVKARFPLLAPADALEQIGTERQMPRGPGEGDGSYAARIQVAWDTWRYAGTARGLLTALSAAGYPGAELRIQNAVRYYLDSGEMVVEQRAPGEWWIDSNRTFWSRFVVLLKPPYPLGWVYGTVVKDAGAGLLPVVTGDTATFIGTVHLKVTTTGPSNGTATFEYSLDGGSTWSADQLVTQAAAELGATGIFVAWPGSLYGAGDAFHFDSSGPVYDAARVAILIARWKPAHAICTDIFVIPSGRTWDSYPTGATWDAQDRATWDSDLATPIRWSP